jgi:glucose-6-phosphate isomerase
MTELTQSSAWKALEAHYAIMKDVQMKDMFAQDSERFNKFSMEFEDTLLDYSKNRISEETMDLLYALAEQQDVKGLAKKMYSGEKINNTEGRAVLHVALRNQSNTPIMVDGKDVMPEVNETLARIKSFTEKVRSGEWKGQTGKSISAIVNIGIGGSDLGPVMVCEALKPYCKRDLDMHFCSNVDGTHIAEILKKCDPETTLFLIASKTFTTQETMTNAGTAKKWVLDAFDGDASAIARLFLPTPNLFRNSVLILPTCLDSGTGSVDGIPCGVPSVPRLHSPSALTTGWKCTRVPMPWINTL